MIKNFHDNKQTKWEDLESTAIYAIGEINGGLEGVNGTMSGMAEIQEATFGQRFQSTIRGLKDAMRPLGEVLLKLAEEAMPYLESGAKKLSEWFTALSPAGKQLSIIIGAIGVVIGPVIGVIGKLVAGIGKLIPHLKNAGSFMGLLTRAAAFLTGPVGVTIGILAGLGVAAYKVGKAMNTSALEYDVFGDKVSEGTKKAVGSYLEMDKEIRTSINEMAWSNKVVTKEMADDMISKYQKMGDVITQEMKKDHAEQLEATTKMFAESSALTEEEEKEILKKMQENDAKELKEHEKRQARIKEIWETAVKEKRDITDVERAELNNLNNQMKNDAVLVLSESAEEQKAILTSLKHNKGKINAEMAADTVQQSLKTKEETIKNAEDECTEKIMQYERMRDESGEITAEQAKKLIDEAKKQRDETKKYAEEMHENVVTEAKAQAGEHVNEVNWTTGEVLSQWDIIVRDTKAKMKEIWENTVTYFKEMGKSIKENLVLAWETTVTYFKNMGISIKENLILAYESVKKFFTDIYTKIVTSISDAYTKVKTFFSDIYTKINTAVTDSYTTVKTKFEDIKTAITTKIEAAKTKVSEIIEDIKGFFTGLKLKIPDIGLPKMPDFSKIKLPKLPKMNFKFNARGGFTDGPVVVGSQGGAAAIAGEAGKEAIIPLSAHHKKNMQPFSNAVADTVLKNLNRTSQQGALAINVSSLVVREEADIQRIARELFVLQQRKNRGL